MTEADTFLLDAVEDFLTLFTREFPSENVKPKMHFMVHYGTHCRMFGPLVQYWSFRFEGKHGYFKDIACRLKCRKNVLVTLAKKHQYYQAWHLHQTGAYLHDGCISNSNGKQMPINDIPLHLRTVLQPVIANECVFQASSVDVDGVTYECGLAVITGVDNGDVLLSVICSLFIVNRKLYMICCRIQEVIYCRHFHSFTGVVGQSYHLIDLTDLVHPHPLPVYECSDNSVCVLF